MHQTPEHQPALKNGDILVWKGTPSLQSIDELNRYAKRHGATDILHLKTTDITNLEVLTQPDITRLQTFIRKHHPTQYPELTVVQAAKHVLDAITKNHNLTPLEHFAIDNLRAAIDHLDPQ